MIIRREKYNEMYNRLSEHLSKNMDYLNNFWNALNKMVVTCATSILFGSIAFVSLPFFRENYNLSLGWFVVSWILLLISILTLIIGSIEQAKFWALYNMVVARNINRLYNAVQQQDEYAEMENMPLIDFSNILPCAMGFSMFLFGAVLLVVALLSTIFPSYAYIWHIGCAVICTLILCWIIRALTLFFKAKKHF